jgi:predicted O-methyltransferase YrrM
MGISNIVCKTGSFEKHFLNTLKAFEQVDFILFDGNHRLEPTLKYFKEALSFVNENTVFVFDDIYWSDEMKQAWEIIKNDPKVAISIDLYDIGLVFFKKGQVKQHFKLRI